MERQELLSTFNELLETYGKHKAYADKAREQAASFSSSVIEKVIADHQIKASLVADDITPLVPQLSAEIASIATSIKKETHCDVAVDDFVKELLPRLESRLDLFFQRGVEAIREPWLIRADKERFFEIAVEGSSIVGKVVGLDKDGSLLFRGEDEKVRRVVSGELVPREMNADSAG